MQERGLGVPGTGAHPEAIEGTVQWDQEISTSSDDLNHQNEYTKLRTNY